MRLTITLLTLLLGACSPRKTAIESGAEALDAGAPDAGLNGWFFGRSFAARTYHLFAPPRNADERRPIVLLLHGNGGSADQLLGRGGKPAPFKRWGDIAARERLFLVVPDGAAPSGGEQGWNDCRADATTNPTTDDVGFVMNLIDSLESEGVDRGRVFVNGISNGGNMALRLAIERGSSFRAVAAIVASMPARSECVGSSAPVSVLFINGTNDSIMPFDGGAVAGSGARGTVISTRAAVDAWRAINGVTEAESERMLPDSFPSDGCTVVEVASRRTWPTVALLRVVGGGHTEPSPSERYTAVGLLVLGRQSGDIEMAEEVHRFFAAQGP